MLLEDADVQAMIERYSRDTVMEAIHIEMDKLRAFIGKIGDEEEELAQFFLLKRHIKMKRWRRLLC